MRLLFRSGIGAIALLAGTATLSFEPAVLRDLAVHSGGASLSVGAVRTSLWNAALAQSADTFSLENVTLQAGSATYRMKRIDFAGVTTPRAEIEAIFGAGSAQPLADRLGRISARQIVIPEIVADQTMGPLTQRTTYRNVTADAVQSGRVTTLTAETTAQEMTTPKGKSTTTQGRSTISDIDLAALAHLYLDRGGQQPEPLTKIYGSFVIENSTVSEANGATIRIERITGSDFRARPTQDSWSGTISMLFALSETDKLSTEDETRLITAVTDMIDAMDFGALEATGIDVSNPAAQTGKATSSRIARMSYASARDGQPSQTVIEGLQAGTGDGGVKIDSVSVTGFSLRPTLDGLRALRGKSMKSLSPEQMRSLIPVLGTTKMSGFSIDVPNAEDKSPTPERIKASLKSFELTADQPVDGLATNFRLGLQNYVMALPASSEEEGVKTLIDWGYTSLDVSFLVSTRWNAASNSLDVSELSFQGKDMGDVAIKGTLGNVSKDVFNPDTAVASVALMAATVKSLDVTLENKGLFDRYLAKAAQDQRTKPETLRRTYGTAAAFLIPSMIGNSDGARTIGQAVSKFIAKPGRITLQATSKDPAGVGVADFAAQPEPGEIIKLIDVTAKNE
ncbi:hypothetical protein [Microvirga pudoricolor]|uniref:hypothetical protein n=1 Tax=Microvirga pudoricolor TaxID=2778729 RepID=UPI001951AACE|nr:hypothetical protein [Microvirga pudoricolor]MBM6596111.1 hypothetical protein [Microvirga pudoricolor]